MILIQKNQFKSFYATIFFVLVHSTWKATRISSVWAFIPNLYVPLNRSPFLIQQTQQKACCSTMTAKPNQYGFYVGSNEDIISNKDVTNLMPTCLKSKSKDDEEEDNEEKKEPSQAQRAWLENRSSTGNKEDVTSLLRKNADSSNGADENDMSMTSDEAEELSGNVNIPKTGISIDDEMVSSQSSNFETSLLPLNTYPGTATIVTRAIGGLGDEPLRYIVPTTPPPIPVDGGDDSSTAETAPIQTTHYAMVDIPPYSEALANEIQSFLNATHNNTSSEGVLSTMLVTSRTAIHYDEAPAVYVTRKSDILAWKKHFPNVEIVMYRLDMPRDCREVVTQVLDGYGPWALDYYNDLNESAEEKKSNVFVETGRPLTRMEWDEETQKKVLDEGLPPPDDDDDSDDEDQTKAAKEEEDDSHLYTPQAIRKREENKKIIALYTPGHTHGSMTFVFPQTKICCSGYTIPAEDSSSSADGADYAGPKMDYRGYITTNQGGISRQMSSARKVVNTYGDRFEVVLPSRGEGFFLGGGMSVGKRIGILRSALEEYEEVGRVYERLGIL